MKYYVFVCHKVFYLQKANDTVTKAAEIRNFWQT